MRAVQYSEYGDADVLHVVDDAPEPHPGPGQVRIRVKAAGVTPADWYLRSGSLQQIAPLQLPHIPGVDAAGIVDEIGEDTNDVRIGDEVFGLTPPAQSGGAFAEFAILDAWASKPARVSWEEVGGLAANVETATRALDELAVRAGMTVLVEGASGGVGTILIQLAHARGARVVGTASSANHALLRSLGAEATTYGEGLVERVRTLAPEGVDVAIDSAGAGSLPRLIEITGAPDHVLTLADFSAAEYGVRLSTSAGPGADGQDGRDGLTIASELLDKRELTVPIHAVYPHGRAADAHRESETRRARGKIIVTFFS